MEAIIDSSTQNLTGDVLNYVLKVASNKWKTEQQQENASFEYVKSIDEAKEATARHNKQLAGKLKPKRRGR